VVDRTPTGKYNWGKKSRREAVMQKGVVRETRTKGGKGRKGVARSGGQMSADLFAARAGDRVVIACEARRFVQELLDIIGSRPDRRSGCRIDLSEKIGRKKRRRGEVQLKPKSPPSAWTRGRIHRERDFGKRDRREDKEGGRDGEAPAGRIN